jgi:hypothetical protein
MARFVQVEFPAQHGGVVRFSRGFEAIGNFSITRGVLHALALIGAPVTRAAAKVGQAFAGLAAASRQRKADEQLWRIAQTDARVMADLSRAMSREAQRSAHYY